jgi:hypothetical protein
MTMLQPGEGEKLLERANFFIVDESIRSTRHVTMWHRFDDKSCAILRQSAQGDRIYFPIDDCEELHEKLRLKAEPMFVPCAPVDAACDCEDHPCP